MASLNKIMLIGNAGRDAELRYTAGGTAQSQFSLAVNRNRKNPAGEWESETEWFNIILFGDQAERISQNVTKGKSLYVEGRIQTRNWDDDSGVKHTRVEVIANSVLFLDRREGASGAGGADWGDGAARPAAGRPAGAGYNAPRGGSRGDVEPDDLPFE
ncbi:MAG TPA: single-stranded DNA-binding protein [Candidatus Dormibacteraeota bacterium]|nr:single-stranded DNA-binding protein [Candidatus Dormibacteraeota bacterium]